MHEIQLQPLDRLQTPVKEEDAYYKKLSYNPNDKVKHVKTIPIVHAPLQAVDTAMCHFGGHLYKV